MASKNSSGQSYGSGRTRNYATVVYPESAPKDWKDTLSSQFVPAFISPLHDKDKNPTGEDKKAHYHVLIMFDTVKTKEQAEKIFASINGVGCEVVNSLRGYARYLTHMDNPEKHQYSADDVTCLCGSDYTTCIGLPTDKYKVIGEMIAYCKENDIFSYSDLLEYSMMNHYDWFRVLCDSGTLVVKEYLKSKRWTSQQDDFQRKIDMVNESEKLERAKERENNE